MPSESRMPAPTMEYAEVNGIRIAYDSFGKNERGVILLIAGTGMQLIEWPMELVEGLVEQGYRVIRFDNRDCGLSTKFTEAGNPDPEAISQAMQAGKPIPIPYTLQDMSKDAVGLLDVLGIPKAHFVGASMGGAIAQLAAIDFPERVLSLSLISADSGNSAIPVIAKPEAFSDVPPMPQDDREGFIQYRIETDKVLDSPGYPTDKEEIATQRMRSIMRSYDPQALLRQQTIVFLDRFIGTHRYSNLCNIKVPTVIIHGADDVLVPIEAAKDIEKNILKAKLIIIPGMNHSIPTMLVPEFVRIITENAASTS